jgi:hypothetical protein
MSMLARLPRHFRLLLSGLGWAVLLHGAGEAWRMGPSVFVLFVLVVLTTVVRWGRESGAAPHPARRSWSGGGVGALGRSAQDDEPSWSEPSKVHPAFERPFWARVKIWIGAAGLVLCGLLWLIDAAILFLPDPMPEGPHPNTMTLLTVSVLLTMLFLVFLRSGLRGPTDPFAPDERKTGLGEDSLSLAPDEGHEPTRNGRKKSHLRLVRPAP